MTKTKKAALALLLGFPLCLLLACVLGYLHGVHPLRNSRDWAAEFTRYASRIPNLSDADQRAWALAQGAKAATQVGELRVAEDWATEAVALLPQMDPIWFHGTAMHDAHMALGRVALARGDRTRAREELRLAGSTPGSFLLEAYGPNMLLARDMLKAGERDAVLAYFRDCRRFWPIGRSRLTRWEYLVKLGLPPDFGANLSV